MIIIYVLAAKNKNLINYCYASKHTKGYYLK